MSVAALGRADVEAAARRIAGQVRQTPVLRLAELEAPGGPELWAKCENLQWIGAFKARGAMHACARLDPAVRARGLVTYSSGNHAQAVALAANRYQVRADIAMPENAPAVKVRSVRALGATIHLAGTTSPERKRVAEALVAEGGGAMIEPFDHPDTICGQGTATLELLQELDRLGVACDALVVPVGGGGLLAGACLASEERQHDLIAVEPVGCDSMGRSLAANAVVAVDPAPTIADGLKPTSIGSLNLEICRNRVARTLTVDDVAIRLALADALTRARILIEPSAAAALAAARNLTSYRRIAVILSGGNVDPTLVAEILHSRTS